MDCFNTETAHFFIQFYSTLFRGILDKEVEYQNYHLI